MSQNLQGIWLEVVEVRYETKVTDQEEQSEEPACKVLLKGDREHPKPVWWPVEPTVLGKKGDDAALETYRAILNEFDKKRSVLAWLSNTKADHSLHCMALRFQAPDSGSR